MTFNMNVVSSNFFEEIPSNEKTERKKFIFISNVRVSLAIVFTAWIRCNENGFIETSFLNFEKQFMIDGV